MPKRINYEFVTIRITPAIEEPISIQTLVQHSLKSCFGESSARYTVDVLDSRLDHVSGGALAVLRILAEDTAHVLAALTTTMYPPKAAANHLIAVEVVQISKHLATIV